MTRARRRLVVVAIVLGLSGCSAPGLSRSQEGSIAPTLAPVAASEEAAARTGAARADAALGDSAPPAFLALTTQRPGAAAVVPDNVLAAAVLIISKGDVGAALHDGAFSEQELEAAIDGIANGTLGQYVR